MPLRKVTELFLVQVAEGRHSSRPHGSLHCPPLYAKVKQAIVRLSPRDSSHSHPWQSSSTDGHFPESECGFWKGCETANMMPFATRQLQEECQQQN